MDDFGVAIVELWSKIIACRDISVLITNLTHRKPISSRCKFLLPVNKYSTTEQKMVVLFCKQLA